MSGLTILILLAFASALAVLLALWVTLTPPRRRWSPPDDGPKPRRHPSATPRERASRSASTAKPRPHHVIEGDPFERFLDERSWRRSR